MEERISCDKVLEEVEEKNTDDTIELITKLLVNTETAALLRALAKQL